MGQVRLFCFLPSRDFLARHKRGRTLARVVGSARGSTRVWQPPPKVVGAGGGHSMKWFVVLGPAAQFGGRACPPLTLRGRIGRRVRAVRIGESAGVCCLLPPACLSIYPV